MGTGVIEAGMCTGADVLKELNKPVFSDPTSDDYKFAQSNNWFGDVPDTADNYLALVGAYAVVGVPVFALVNWVDYLQSLGQQNINLIAQARDEGLTSGVAMTTTKHQHTAHPGQVTKKKESNGKITISSPFNNP
jgi:hypothetical protein